MTGEEVYIRGLLEMSTGEKKTSISERLGRHSSDQSRAMAYFVNHIYNNFKHLVQNNLLWWYKNGYMEMSAAAIEEKIGFRGDRRYALFIDCNCLETSRPGGGPRDEGANSIRWSKDVQRSFYNGWKSIHGLKHQTVDNAFGFTVDMYGPTSLRRNDLTLYRLSDINDRVREMGQNQYHVFGDSAYKGDSNVSSYDDNFVDSRLMKSVRISIEWNYMVTLSLFVFISLKRKLKVFGTAAVSRIYTVATLLKNFYSCLYGNMTMNYFNLTLHDDFLEKYINGVDN